jgi:branched-chain amino acid transport system substrate-binding protein
MKRLIYLSSALALVTSLVFVGGRTYAAHQGRTTLNVKLCVGAPIGIPSNRALVQGIYNGTDLATRRQRARFARIGINLVRPVLMDYAKSDGSGNDPNKARSDALSCINDRTVYGYVGTLNSSIALVVEPVLNRSGLVMVSPANTNPTLTSPRFRASQEPLTYRHTIPYPTYYRVVTTDIIQGASGALFLKNQLGVRRYFLVDDKQTYGAGLAEGVRSYANRLGLKVVGTGHIDPTDASTITSSSSAIADQVGSTNADAVYYAGNLETGYTFVKDLRRAGYQKPVMGGDAITSDSWVTFAGKRATRLNYATSVGPKIESTNQAFRNLYRRTFPSATQQPYDALSWDAANIIYNAIYQAANQGKLRMGNLMQRRLAVVRNVRFQRFTGATGTNSFDKNGDTTNQIVSYYKVAGTTWAYLARAPRIPGLIPAGT